MIYSFIEGQIGVGKVKRFFGQSRSAAALADCKASLQLSIDVFIVRSRLEPMVKLRELWNEESKHIAELLELIGGSDLGSDASSLISFTPSFSTGTSTSSLPLLPPQPKIFHGRETEMQALVEVLLRDGARVAILGPGGIGKTSLASAALHDRAIALKYPERHFVSCDSAGNCDDLVASIAAALGFVEFKNLPQRISRYFLATSPSLLVLDNLETAWEPQESRGDVEAFLSLLADIPQLALVVTMRGAERPGKVNWTRPFLGPLQPLTPAAARQTFLDITDDDSSADVDDVLRLTNNLPLAISLIANLSAYEGCSSVLSRWESENTTVLSDGAGKDSNLDLSISLSLSSPRMLSSPNALQLLSVLALLPDGISDADLTQSGLFIVDLFAAKSTLLRTSLGYIDQDRRLKALVPIREYIRHHHPPPTALSKPLQQYFHRLILLWEDHRQISSGNIVPRITANLANLQSLILYGLDRNDPNVKDTIRSMLTLDSFTRAIGRGLRNFLNRIRDLVASIGDPTLQCEYTTALFLSWMYNQISAPEALSDAALKLFREANDIAGEARFNRVFGAYHHLHNGDASKALELYEAGLVLAEQGTDRFEHSTILEVMADALWQIGAYSRGKVYARKAHEIAAALPNFVLEAHCLRVEGICCMALSQFTQAAELCLRARERLALCGLQNGQLDLICRSTLANIHFLKTEYAESRSLQLEIAQETSADKMLNHAYALMNIAFIDTACGVPETTVVENLEPARAIFRSAPFPRGLAGCDFVLSLLHLREGRGAAAKSAFEALYLSSRGKHGEILIMCLEQLADLGHQMDDIQTTAQWAAVFLASTLKARNRLGIAHAVRCFGGIFSAHGDQVTALSLLQVALAEFAAMGVRRYAADCSLLIGKILESQGIQN
ncbi:hypothetical protein C8R46DRAFT_237285 [Mycena filopes]|nr:hypothetical protein C8R46DRAFT_237285 [Mycena filopes]